MQFTKLLQGAEVGLVIDDRPARYHHSLMS